MKNNIKSVNYNNNFKKKGINSLSNQLRFTNTKNCESSQIINADLLERRINSKIEKVLIDINEIREIGDRNHSKERTEMKEIKDKINSFINFKNEILNYMKTLENQIKKLSEELNNITKKVNISSNADKEYPSSKKESKIVIDASQNIYEENKTIKDFLILYKPKDLGFKYFEPYEIIKEREKINEKIKNVVFDSYLPEEDNSNETAGIFLYSIGGISRRALNLANNIYSELFEEYRKYLKSIKDSLSLDHEKDRTKLSIWVKKCLNQKKLYEYYSNLNLNKIKEYLYPNDERTNQFLIDYFKDFISLYLKCLLSIPLVEVKFTKDNCTFENDYMHDIIYKKRGKNKQVNFCYLPLLKSNGKIIEEGESYVFTFMKDTFHIKENLFNNEKIEQNSLLYSIPDIKNINLSSKLNYVQEKIFEMIFSINPEKISEIKPHFCLEEKFNEEWEKIDENETGIFKIKEKNLKNQYRLKIFDFLGREIECRIINLN